MAELITAEPPPPSPCNAELGSYEEFLCIWVWKYNVNIPVSYTQGIQEFCPSFCVILILSPKV